MSEYKNIEGMESLSEEQAEQVVGGATDTSCACGSTAVAKEPMKGSDKILADTAGEKAQLEGTTSSTDSLATNILKVATAECAPA